MNDRLRHDLEEAMADLPGCKTAKLYAQILGIKRPWYVREVQLRLRDGEVDIFLEHDADVR
jgi:hypothetical protein